MTRSFVGGDEGSGGAGMAPNLAGSPVVVGGTELVPGAGVLFTPYPGQSRLVIGADPAAAPPLHHTTHESGGADQVSVAGLSGLLATPQTPAAHTHAEADVTGLVADLAGKQAALPSLTQFSLLSAVPFLNASANITPAAITGSLARVFPFTIPAPITINGLYVRTNLADTACLIIGIFNSAGTQVLRTAALSAVIGWVAVASGTTPALPVTLQPGTYYLAATNNNSASVLFSLKATGVLSAAQLPRWGTVAAVAGAMPASIDPTAITQAGVQWICEIVLSSVTS